MWNLEKLPCYVNNNVEKVFVTFLFFMILEKKTQQ